MTPAVPQVDPMKDLMNQMTQLLQPMTHAISQLQQQMAQVQQKPSYPPRQQYQAPPATNPAVPTYRPRQPRNTLTCHRCGQYGHIARVCTNQIATQVPVQPTAAAPQQPTLYATAPPLQTSPPQTQPLYAPPQQDVTPQPVLQAQPTRNVRFSSPAQISRPDVTHFCVDDEQDEEYLNF